jgi:hypothetical protein
VVRDMIRARAGMALMLTLASWCGALALVTPAVARGARPDLHRRALTIRWGETARLTLLARPVSVPVRTPEGPGTVRLKSARGREAEAPSGEGIIALTMASPQTSWASASDTSTVAEVSLDGGPPQSIELFAGPEPFTYEGFLGPLTRGRHRLAILNSSTLAHAGDRPSIRITAVQLGIVARSDPDYLADAYAPFIYGRSSSASMYIPLLTYVQQSRGADGSTVLSYTYIISAHDQGDSIVPAYQWGTWGRMTDIVSIITETVAPDGAIISSTYSSCACEGTPYPDGVQSVSDSTVKPFQGSYLGHHPMLRDATATNYLSDQGTTDYHFQQAPVAGPAPGQVREAVMDAHPWTYRISNEELPREHLISTSPDNLLVGAYRQYAIIDANLSSSGSEGVEFDLRLAGSPTWYTTDYAQMSAGVPSDFVFHDGGHNRWVIKLPLNWERRAVSAFEIRVLVAPGHAPATLVVHSLRLLEITSSWRVRARRLPRATVVQAPGADPGPLPL